MPSQILFNNEIYHPTEDDLPCLITYGEKAGGSHFSVTMVADLFLRGAKILFFTAYPMAKDNFLEQIKGNEEKVSYVTDVNDLNINAQAIVLESGNEKLYLQVIEKLNDLSERIVLIKNMEVFDDLIFDHCLKLKKVILSGDIDKCIAKEEIIAKQCETIVAFTKPRAALPIEIPALEKYTAYFWNIKKQGLVMVKM